MILDTKLNHAKHMLESSIQADSIRPLRFTTTQPRKASGITSYYAGQVEAYTTAQRLIKQAERKAQP
jgi:hypothetical protein